MTNEHNKKYDSRKLIAEEHEVQLCLAKHKKQREKNVLYVVLLSLFHVNLNVKKLTSDYCI